MALEAFFKLEDLAPILQNPNVECIKFKLISFKHGGWAIRCTGCEYKYEGTQPGNGEPVDIAPTTQPLHKVSFWTRVFNRKKIVRLQGVLKQDDITPLISTFSGTPSGVDVLAQQFPPDTTFLPDDPGFKHYGFVVFPKDEIAMGIFSNQFTVTNASKGTIGLTVRQMLLDFGVSAGHPSCSKAISLYVEEKRGPNYQPRPQVDALSVDVLKVRIGQPCPPDWWYRFDFLINPG